MEKYIEDTINYYDENYNEYYETWNIDFLENLDFKEPDIFLSYLSSNSKILDLGCGSGRDSLYFINKGYEVKSIDGSKKMCELTSKLLNKPVENINFFDLNYTNEFDGVFACASLLHLNNEDLIYCLKKVIKALKLNGIIYVSFKYGEEERIKNGRYFNDMTEEKFNIICSNLSEIKIIKSWKSESYNHHKSFINFILQKVGNQKQ